jgi:hypothetical protein
MIYRKQSQISYCFVSLFCFCRSSININTETCRLVYTFIFCKSKWRNIKFQLLKLKSTGIGIPSLNKIPKKWYEYERRIQYYIHQVMQMQLQCEIKLSYSLYYILCKISRLVYKTSFSRTFNM